MIDESSVVCMSMSDVIRSTMSSDAFRIGVLLLPPVQLLDLSPVDLFGMCTKKYLLACQLPAPITALGVPIEINYITEAGAGVLAECTANAGLRTNASLDDNGSAPGTLDLLMIPGPDPAVRPSDKVKAFIRDHAASKTDVLTVCTGIFPAGYAGILKGRRATGPRALLPELRSRFPGTEWTDRRWERDANIWSSGQLTPTSASTSPSASPSAAASDPDVDSDSDSDSDLVLIRAAVLLYQFYNDQDSR